MVTTVNHTRFNTLRTPLWLERQSCLTSARVSRVKIDLLTSLVLYLFKKIDPNSQNSQKFSGILFQVRISMKDRDRVPFGPVQRKREREKKVKNTRRMSNRFPIPSIRHIRNVECHARVIDGFWCRPMSAQRRKSRRTYFSRDRFIQFDLVTRHP